jgi:hypothetical protein
VGARGAHVVELVAALGDLQLDVVAWHPDPVRAAIEALSGVEVLDVETDGDDERGVLTVRVAREDVRAAVGARGANARLAAKLAGWRDVRIVAVDDGRGGADEVDDIPDVIVLSEEGARRFEELVEMEHETKLGDVSQLADTGDCTGIDTFVFGAAAAAAWDEATAAYEAQGLNITDVITQAAKAFKAMRGVPASEDLPEDGEI